MQFQTESVLQVAPRKRKPVPVKAAIKPLTSEKLDRIFVDVTFPVRLLEHHHPEPVEELSGRPLVAECKPLEVGSKGLGTDPLRRKNRIMSRALAKQLGEVPLTSCRIGLSSAIYMIRGATDRGIAMERVGVGSGRTQVMTLDRFQRWIGSTGAQILFARDGVLYSAVRLKFSQTSAA